MSTTLFKKLLLYGFILVIFGSIFGENNVYAMTCIPGTIYELWTGIALLEIIISPYTYLYGSILGILILSIFTLLNKDFISKKYIKIGWYTILAIIIVYFGTGAVLGQNLESRLPSDPFAIDCHSTIYRRKDVLSELMIWFSITHIISGVILLLGNKISLKSSIWKPLIIIINIIAITLNIYILIMDERGFATINIVVPIILIITLPSLIGGGITIFLKIRERRTQDPNRDKNNGITNQTIKVQESENQNNTINSSYNLPESQDRKNDLSNSIEEKPYIPSNKKPFRSIRTIILTIVDTISILLCALIWIKDYNGFVVILIAVPVSIIIIIPITLRLFVKIIDMDKL